MPRRLPLLLALLAFACGGSTPTPAAPSSQTPSAPQAVSAIDVTLDNTVVIAGATTTARGIVRRSDGSTGAITTGWHSDTPSVATVTDAGVVTGVANGRANIYVVSDGRQGQTQARVVPDYRGQWTGPYTVLTCSQTTELPTNFCSGFNPNSSVRWPSEFLGTQSGDIVVWRYFLSSSATSTTWDAPISLRIAEDGTLPVTRLRENYIGTGPYRGIPLDVTETLTLRRTGSTLIQVGTSLRRFRLPGTTTEVSTQTLQYSTMALVSP